MTNDPKSAELSAAVERLRRLKAGEPMLSVYEWGDPNTRYRADRTTCSDAYLATVAADEQLAKLFTAVKDNLEASKRLDDGREWFRGYIAATQDAMQMVQDALNIPLQPIAQETQS